jgi:tetratricopeptide (TPR) repeat protein
MQLMRKRFGACFLTLSISVALSSPFAPSSVAQTAPDDVRIAEVRDALERGQWSLARAQLDLLLASSLDDGARAEGLYLRSRLHQADGRVEAALSDLRSIARLNAPLDIADDVAFLNGELLYALDRHGEAGEAFGDFLRQFPDDPRRLRATWFRAEALSRGSGVDEAERLYSVYIETADEPKERQQAYFGRAWCRHEPCDDNGALEDFTRAIDGPDRDLAAKARFEAGVACQRLGRLADARSWLEERRGPVRAAPGRLDLTLGQVYFAMGELDEAVPRLEAAYPDSDPAVQPYILYQMGWGRLKLDDTAGAAKSFEALTASATSVDSLIVAGQYGLGVSRMRLGETEGAIQAMERVRAAGATRFADEARYALSFLYNKAGNVEASERVIAELRRVHPNSPLLRGAELVEGENRFQDKRYEEAIQIFERQIEAGEGDHAEALFRLGISYFKLDRSQDAERSLAELVLRYPQSPHRLEARFWLAEARYRLNDVAGARREYLAVTTAGGDGPRRFDAAYGLAWCDYRDRAYEDAHRRFDELLASRMRPEREADLLLRRGNCAYNLGRFEEAVGDYDLVLQRYPQGAEAARALERKAWSLHRVDRFDAARGVFEMVATRAEDPEQRAEATYWAGFSAFKAEKYTDAAPLFERVLKEAGASDSLQVESRFRLAECAFNSGEFDLASDRYRALAEGSFAPDVRRAAHEALVQSLEQTGSATEAVEAAAEMVETFPESNAGGEALFRQGASHIEAKRYREGLTALNEFLADGKPEVHLVEANRLAAEAALELGEPLRAAEYYRNAAHHGTREDGITYRFEAGRLFFEAAKHAQAREEFTKVVRLNPEPAVLHLAQYNLGLSLKELDEPKAAMDAFGDVAESESVENTLRAEALLEHGLLARNLGKNDRASKSLCRAAEIGIGSTGAEAQYWCAEIHFEANRYDSAIAGYRRVVGKFGSETDWGITARYRLAEAFEQINRWSEAREEYQIILESTEDAAWRSDAEERLNWIKENSWVFEEEPKGDPSRW